MPRRANGSSSISSSNSWGPWHPMSNTFLSAGIPLYTNRSSSCADRAAGGPDERGQVQERPAGRVEDAEPVPTHPPGELDLVARVHARHQPGVATEADQVGVRVAVEEIDIVDLDEGKVGEPAECGQQVVGLRHEGPEGFLVVRRRPPGSAVSGGVAAPAPLPPAGPQPAPRTGRDSVSRIRSRYGNAPRGSSRRRPEVLEPLSERRPGEFLQAGAGVPARGPRRRPAPPRRRGTSPPPRPTRRGRPA